MHKVPGKRKISYGADTVAPVAPVALDKAAGTDQFPATATTVPDTGDVKPVPPAVSHQDPAVTDTLAKFNVVKTQLLRSHSRYLVKWEVALIHQVEETKLSYYGKINDISENGLSMFCDYNVFFNGKVKLVMTLPPLHIGMQAQKIEVESRMVYTILSQYSFRIGLEFVSFRDGEKKILMDRLESSNSALKPGTA